MKRIMRRGPRFVALAVGLAVGLASSFASGPAQAWDPSTTHAAMTAEAVVRSGMHVRWMDASGLSRGIFTGVRVHPSDLDPDTLRAIRVAARRVHEASGAAPLGGPGACPGPSAPAVTQARCVDGDVWEMTALGWIQLGVVLETTPRHRLLHHFADGTDPSSPTWSDPELPASVLRSKVRRAEDPIARSANRSAFAGGATSAVAWLSDRSDPWAPPATLAHLRAAETASTARERDRELALGLIGLGALLHVVQDQSVPAHARGDLTAFFAPLSPIPGDRGLPLQEYVRVLYGRNDVPAVLPLSPRDASRRAGPLAPTLHQHLVGHGDYPGLTRYTATHFWSESSLPPAQHVSAELDGEAAATALIGEGHGLDPAEVDGATLSPWPASTGYLRSASGRGLAAFDTDAEGRIRLFLDRRIYRDQAAHLVPAGIEASASVLDLLFPAFPAHTVDFDTGVIDIDLTGGMHAPVLSVLIDTAGKREEVQTVRLRAGERNHIVDAFEGPLAEGAQLVLRLEGSTAPQHGVAQVATALPKPAPAPEAPVPEAPAVERPAAPPEAAATPSSPAALPSAAAPVESPRGPSQTELISPYDDATPKAEPDTKAEPDPAPKAPAADTAPTVAPKTADSDD
ncbi:MAG: hypothetical protein NXI35_32495 [bacterium]|nr:hypothetical protein [bacterium]